MSALSDLQALLSAIPLPAALIGPDDRIMADNSLVAALLGTQARGRHYIAALRQPAVLEAIEQTRADRQIRATRYLGTEAGRDTTWRVTASCVPLDAGAGVLLTFEDITAVEEAGQIRRDFVANISHELRSPLTALLGFLETLKGPAREDPKARERFLAIMETEAGRMARLIDDLLSLSRVEEEQRVRPVAPVDLSALLGEAAEFFAPLAEQAGLRLDTIRPETGIIVPGDAVQLRQVLDNLIENAIKYGRSGNGIELRLTAPQAEESLRREGVRLIVTDFGDGIAAHHIARLTERFYRVDAHRSREVGGTGLGLAIVKHIVHRHRGRLRIESEPGKGSRFRVILPTT